jgi:hypothetical protein
MPAADAMASASMVLLGRALLEASGKYWIVLCPQEPQRVYQSAFICIRVYII